MNIETNIETSLKDIDLLKLVDMDWKVTEEQGVERLCVFDTFILELRPVYNGVNVSDVKYGLYIENRNGNGVLPINADKCTALYNEIQEDRAKVRDDHFLAWYNGLQFK